LGFCSRRGSPRIGAAPIFALDKDERGLGEGEVDIIMRRKNEKEGKSVGLL